MLGSDALIAHTKVFPSETYFKEEEKTRRESERGRQEKI